MFIPILFCMLIVDAYSVCLLSRPCPCGKSGQSYMQCFETSFQQYSCDRWIHCETCEEYNQFCVTCPPGRDGLTCKNEKKEVKKRDLRQKHGDSVVSSRKECTFRVTGNSSFNCTTGTNRQVSCDVTCNNKHLGRYHCFPGRGWNAPLPNCHPSRGMSVRPVKIARATCPDPKTPEGATRRNLNGNHIPSRYIFKEGDVVVFFCNDADAALMGSTRLTCRPDATWDGTLPRCVPSKKEVSSCKHPGVVENGIIEDFQSAVEQFPIGTFLKFVCRDGYEREGPEIIYCLRNLSWSEKPPVCKLKTSTVGSDCLNPGLVENGVLENYPPQTERFPAGAALRFRCREGYEMEGPESIYCIIPGKWSGSLPKCRFIPPTPVSEVSCSHPGMVTGGTFEGMSQTSFLVGSVLTFRCIPGTRMEGQRNIYCLNNGIWSAPPPNCKSAPTRRVLEPEKVSRITCKHPGMIENGGNELIVTELYMMGEQLQFKCREGYTLVGQDAIQCESTGKWSSAPPQCIRAKNLPDCGRVFHEDYQLSGRRSGWPWTVGLSTVKEDNVQKVFCGGALLDSRTVVTAAHCLKGAQNIKLHFGYRRPIPEQVRNVSQIIRHPEYDDASHANDIALVKFDRHVYFDPTTQPICLPTPTVESSGKNLLPGTTSFVTGYGLEFTGNHSSTPSFKVFELPVQSEDVCEPVCRDQGLLACNPSTFCAGYLKDTKECIYGGTPLAVFHKGKNRYTLEGLVTRAESARNSWNGKCKRPESYTTFTNVTHFMDFILENLN